MRLVEYFATTADARQRCIREGDKYIHLREWISKHAATLEAGARNHMPSGSGFDCGTRIDLDASTGERLVFLTEFHHMDEHGGYDGWTSHRVTVRPSLVHGFTVTVSGRDRNGIKDHIADVFDSALRAEVQS